MSRLELELERDKRERDARERELREHELRNMEMREKLKAELEMKPPGEKDLNIMSCDGEKTDFAFAKTKAQISCAVTAQLISAFVFAIRIVLFLFLLNPKFEASSPLL